MKNYEKYDAVELAQDQSFIRWVKASNQSAIQFWEKWLQEHPGKAVLIQEAKTIVLSLQFEESTITDTDIEQLWNNIDQQTEASSITSKPRIISLTRALSAAAAIAIIIIGYLLIYPTNRVQLTADRVSLPSYYLPDSSFVELNHQSSIIYSKSNFEEEKTVRLKGEALFRIEKGAAFAINTALGKVEVLGTVFNVYARNAYLKVSCYEGAVKVTNTAGQIDTLQPGQQIVFRENLGMEKLPFDTTMEKSWKEGFFSFDRVPYQEVFEELERQFEIKIVATRALKEQIYNGSFTDGSLTEALDDVTFIDGLKYEKINDQRYRIYKPERE